VNCSVSVLPAIALAQPAPPPAPPGPSATTTAPTPPGPPNGTGIHQYVITLWAMPSATTSIAGDAKATDVSAMLARSALDHASLTGWVER